MRFTARAAAFTAAVAVALSGAGGAGAATDAPEPPPAGTTTWSLQPAQDGSPDGRVSLRLDVPAGAQVEDQVVLTNFSDTTAAFAVYASDGVLTPEGNFDLLPPGEPAVAGGSWVTIHSIEDAVDREGGGIIVEVPAEATVAVPVSVSIPDNATPGDHPAGIVAELVRGSDDNVQVASRVGVRIHLRVDGDIVAAVEPHNVRATYEPSWNPFSRGEVVINVDVANTGNVRLGAETTATAAGAAGIASSSATVSQRELLPGDESPSTLRVPVVPLFRTWGEVDVAPLVVGDDVIDASLLNGHESFRVWTVPWSQLALLAILVLGTWTVVHLRRRNAARIQKRIDDAVAAATAAQADESGAPARP